MKHWPLHAAALVGGLLAGPGAEAGSEPAARIHQLIVRPRGGVRLGELAPGARVARLEQLSATAGVQLLPVRPMSGGAEVLRLPQPMSPAAAHAVARRLAALPDVLYAELDGWKHPMRVPNDIYYLQQWHYFEEFGIGLPAAWDITTGAQGVVVAVLDTGIRPHADFGNRILPGYDFITEAPIANDGNGRDGDPSDPGDWITEQEGASGYFEGCPAHESTWHGTHTAGTIGASSNNAFGVAGVNWVSRLLPVRVLGKCGGFDSDIADAMRWAAGLSVPGAQANPNPARILNLSLGGRGACSPVYQSAVNDILGAGGIIVVSAANANEDAADFTPANCPGVLTVAATNRSGGKASYSNFGPVVAISAPGGEAGVDGVLSLLNTGAFGPGLDDYAFYSGTSMAAPHVAGAISLMLSVDPTLTRAEVLQILRQTARPFGNGTCTTAICGAGILDAAAALAGLQPRTPTPPGPTPTSPPTATPTRPAPTNPPSPTSPPTPTSPPAATPAKPGAPLDPKLHVNSPSSVSFSWRPGTGAPPAGYRIYASSGAGPFSAVLELPSSKTSYTQALTTTGSYYFKVTGVNGSGESGASRKVQGIAESLGARASAAHVFTNEMAQDLEIRLWAYPAARRASGRFAAQAIAASGRAAGATLGPAAVRAEPKPLFNYDPLVTASEMVYITGIESSDAVATRIDPAPGDFPLQVTSGFQYIYNNADPGDTNFLGLLKIFDDDGPAGAPGQLLAVEGISSFDVFPDAEAGLNFVFKDFAAPPRIGSGSFYVALQWIGPNPDQNPLQEDPAAGHTSTGKSFLYDAGSASWMNWDQVLGPLATDWIGGAWIEPNVAGPTPPAATATPVPQATATRTPGPGGGTPGPCQVTLELRRPGGALAGVLAAAPSQSSMLTVPAAPAGDYTYQLRSAESCNETLRYIIATQPDFVLGQPGARLPGVLAVLGLGMLGLARRRTRT